MFLLRARTATAVSLLGCVLSACGGSSGTPSPSNPAPGTQDPCATAATRGDLEPAYVVAPNLDKSGSFDRNPRWRVLDALWTHRAAAGGEDRTRAFTPSQYAADVGDVAVVVDEGDLIQPPNTYDLRSLGLRFTGNGSGGYDVRRIDGTFRTSLGTALALGDDDSAEADLKSGFSFFGKSRTTAFVNSDGNITFGQPDKSSTERNVARLLTGPPRVAPFLADLDPTAGGRIFVNSASDQYTVTWCSVRGFDSSNTTTVQATLLPDGSIEMKYGTVTLGDAVVGVSPGTTGDFIPVNLSDTGPTGGGSGAVGERFAQDPQLDVVALTRKFYQTHADRYDQLLVWSDSPIVTDAFAYELTVKNEVRGIGVDVYDLADDFGSAGTLRSFVMMDWVGKYPDDPTQKFLGENNTLSLIGQEAGHRWLAFLEFRDHNGQRSDALLGRDLAHWSFFMDSDASVMEGNDIEDLKGGSFRTTASVQRYSLLDQYAMGLVPPTAVPPFFYVENPTNIVPNRTRESAPRVGVTFNGTRRDVLIDDVIAIHGGRVPAAADSPHVHRQAFIHLVSAGHTADAAAIAKIDLIRRAWETFLLQATDGRLTAVTKLQ